MFKRAVNSLFIKIFGGFWLVLLLVVTTVVLLPKLDDRVLTPLSGPSLQKLLQLSASLEQLSMVRPDMGPFQLVARRSPSPRHQLFLVDRDGNIITSRPISRGVRWFMLENDDIRHPHIKKFRNALLAGPVPLRVHGEPYLLYVSQQMPPSHNTLLAKLLDKPILLLCLTMLISALLCLMLAWYLTHPLRKLQKTSAAIANGQLDIELPHIKRHDEIGQLANSFQLMVESIREMINNQQRLLSDISHELRSPLTRLRMATALARRRHDPDHESKELTRIETEAERLEEMIAALLSLSRMQLNSCSEQVIYAIHEQLRPVCEDAAFEAEQLNKHFSYELIDIPPQRGYPALLASAVENIIRNALKYADQQVQLSLSMQEQTLYITVADDGPGVPEEELEQIFRPFYRVSTARDRASGGTGLGLAITSSAIKQHNGQIQARNRKPHGLAITLSLPLTSTSETAST